MPDFNGFAIHDIVVPVLSNSDVPVRTSQFSLIMDLMGRSYRLGFRWNGKYKRYAFRIVRDDDRVMAHYYPKTYFWRYFEGFFDDPDSPDLIVNFYDMTSEGGNLSPDALGRTHQLFLLMGEGVRL